MTKRQTPSGRISKLDVVVVKPFGPHHCARCFGSVQASNTRSHGASNSRTAIIACEACPRSMLFVAGTLFVAMSVIFRIFALQLFQIRVEAIETLVEKTAVGVEPFVDVFQRA